MKRLVAVTVFAVLASGIAFPAILDAQSIPGRAIITITHADAGVDPQLGITVCADGQDPEPLLIGTQTGLDLAGSGSVEISSFAGNQPDCNGTPIDSITVAYTAGSVQGVVFGTDGPFTFDYLAGCVEEGAAGVLVVQGGDETIDTYVTVAGGNGEIASLAPGVAAGTTRYVPDAEPGTYTVLLVTPGADPFDPPLATIPGIQLDADSSFQLFLTGSDGDLGGFLVETDATICPPSAEPPAEPTTSTTSTTTTTRPTAAEPTGAAAAVPVSGTPTFTG